MKSSRRAIPDWRDEAAPCWHQEGNIVQMTLMFVLCAATPLVFGSTASHAEFRLSEQAVSPSVPTPTIEAGTETQKSRSSGPLHTAGPALAQGFGNQIPLSFAVRQVVPKGVTITFAAGIDPAAKLVDWQGGRPWPDVLRTLLRKPGLLATFKPGKVMVAYPPT